MRIATIFCFLAIIIGLILGPGYFVYGKFFSGTTIIEKSIARQNLYSVSGPGIGITVATSTKREDMPIQIALEPAMNPIVIDVRLVESNIRMQVGAIPRAVSFRGDLQDSKGNRVWIDSVEFRESPGDDDESSLDDGGSGGNALVDTIIQLIVDNVLPYFFPTGKTSRLQSFEVDVADTYQLDLIQISDNRPNNRQLEYSHLFLKARANVIEPKLTIAITGILLLIGGIVGFFFTSEKVEQA